MKNLLIGDIFTNAARAVPHRMAAAMGDDSLTFAELERTANQTARALVGLGIGLGDRVVAWSATSLDALPLFAAVAKAGAVFAPANATLGLDEGAEMVGAARPSILVVDEGRADAGAKIASQLGIPLLELTGLAGDRPEPATQPATRPGQSLADLASGQDASPVPCEGLTERDTHVLFFTSGSTGQSKGVILSHRVNFLRTHPGAQLEPRGVMVCTYPLFHMGAWTIALMQWQGRDGVVFVDTAEAATICDAVRRHRAQRINCIPAVWRRLLDHVGSAEGDVQDLSSIRWADSGTSATPPRLLQTIVDTLPQARVRIFYGATESGVVASLEHADLFRKPNSCGVPGSTAEVRIDSNGELCVRGPLLADGYFGNRPATEDAFVDGWYRTGDMAEVDDEGYLTIVGRVRDVIRTGGETVSPSEVEEVLVEHPDIADVAVVGLPDVQWGEVVCAVIVTAGSDVPTVDEVRAHCAARLASFKHPRRVTVVDAIPRTASTNQVQRRLIVERLVIGDGPR
jgi:acyl-CoA synthetase (AMP-forming)/AMP-acid ligase II